MESFTEHTGRVVPLDRVNIDTDQIIPKQFLKRIERTGFGKFLFYDWRYTFEGQLNQDFELNLACYEDASVLVAGKNFGCGSSREHALWSLADYGFRAIIAESFADIFSNNAMKNGIVPVVLNSEEVAELARRARDVDDYRITIDLKNCTVRDALNFSATFEIDDFRRHYLLEGLDEIGLTLQYEKYITAFEASRPIWQGSGANVKSG